MKYKDCYLFSVDYIKDFIKYDLEKEMDFVADSYIVTYRISHDIELFKTSLLNNMTIFVKHLTYVLHAKDS